MIQKIILPYLDRQIATAEKKDEALHNETDRDRQDTRAGLPSRK